MSVAVTAGNDAGICTRIERRRTWAGIAGGGYQHDGFLYGLVDGVAHSRIGRAGKARIDDTSTLLGSPIQPLHDVEGRRFVVGLGAECANREQSNARGRTENGAP